MNRLSENLHPFLNEEVLLRLEKFKIKSILAFINASPHFLVKRSGLDYKSVIEIRKTIFKTYASAIIKGPDLLDKLQDNLVIPTGISKLDKILQGGIHTQLYEICGLPGTGKTEVCLTVLSSVLSNSPIKMLYIDTKRDFSAIRLTEILCNMNQNLKSIPEKLDYLQIAYCQTIYDMYNTLCNITKDNIRLIIIDSLVANILDIENIDERISMISSIGQVCHYIVSKCNTAVIVTNSWKEWKSTDESSSRVGMGQAWEHVPHTRLLFSTNDSQLTVSLLTSRTCGTASAEKFNLQITDRGVIDSED